MIFKTVFELELKKLKLEKSLVLKSLLHRGNKGRTLEHFFRELFKRYLSPEYRFGEGEVIDSYGERSSQIDIVITDSSHPYFNTNLPSIFLIEGVVTLVEVKSDIASVSKLETIFESFKKARRLRSILPSSTYNIPQFISEFQEAFSRTSGYYTITDVLLSYSGPPYFIVGYDKNLKNETALKVFEENFQEHDKNDCPIIIFLDKCVIFKCIKDSCLSKMGYKIGINLIKDDILLHMFKILNLLIPKRSYEIPYLTHYLKEKHI